MLIFKIYIFAGLEIIKRGRAGLVGEARLASFSNQGCPTDYNSDYEPFSWWLLLHFWLLLNDEFGFNLSCVRPIRCTKINATCTVFAHFFAQHIFALHVFAEHIFAEHVFAEHIFALHVFAEHILLSIYLHSINLQSIFAQHVGAVFKSTSLKSDVAWNVGRSWFASQCTPPLICKLKYSLLDLQAKWLKSIQKRDHPL